MLERLRDRLAIGLSVLAQRVTADPRFPGFNRVAPYGRTLAGVVITPDSAVTVAAVWACLRYISQTVAVLPWHVKRDGDKGPEIQASHPIDHMLWKRPSPEYSSFQLRETLTHWALRWGNGYAEIERDQLDRPFALWPLHPERVLVCRAMADTESASGRPIAQGELYYEVSNSSTADGTAARINIAAKDMFHIRGFGEGPVGVNMINYAAQSIGWARAAQLFGSAFFGNNATPSTVVANKRPLSPAGLAKQRAEFEEMHKGPGRAHRSAHIDNDATITRIGFDIKETQLVEVHQHLIEEICRWFGVPPHKVQHLLRATFTNIEQQAIEVVVDCVSPWVKRWEDEAEWKLFGQNRQGLYTKIDMRGLMRGDSAARVAYYEGMAALGAYSPNRILELEDENTIGPAGDAHLVNSTYRSLEWVEGQPITPPTPDEPEEPAPDDADDPEEPEPGQDEGVLERLVTGIEGKLSKEPAHA